MEPAVTAHAGERWELGEEIGSGAIARVVRVRDRQSGHAYAAKLLHPRHERDATARTRFQREAELASRLAHPNLVRVWGTDSIAGHTALVMELVVGETLARRLAREAPLPEAELLALADGIAGGLAYAHACGVIHRDLKPANILLHRGTDAHATPKIADFGMARASSFAEADKGALTVLGTPPYMAPECLDPLAVDPRTDLYALGCILHECATGSPPFGGATPFAMLDAHRSAPIPALPPTYSDGLRKLVAHLLAKAAGDRPQSAGAVQQAIATLRDPNHAALALTQPAAITAAAAGKCAGCGAEVLADVRVCFRCGLVPVVLEPGPNAVLVLGPGRISDKLDSERRDRLVQWLRANESVGFGVEQLERKIPRLPFVLVRGVSATTSSTIVASLERLDIEAHAIIGSPMRHPALRKHVWRMARRGFTLVAAIIAAPALAYGPLAFALLPVVALAGGVVYAIARRSAGRTTVESVPASRPALPPGLAARMQQLPQLVPAIAQRRHREALGAVVGRVLALLRGSPAATEVAAELEHAINLAAVAARRMDEIESMMGRSDFDPADADHRALMQERDMWAARLLDLTATLDALSARMAAAEARVGLQRSEDALASLRANVEALEEVQHL